MNLALLQEKIDAYFASEEGTQHFKEWVERTNNRSAIRKTQIERFHAKWGNNLSEIVDKVVAKYNSDEYVDRWYRRGTEPQEALYSFLLKYAEDYGRDLTDDEYEKYANMFTGSIYIIGDYVVNLMHGQGSAIRISKTQEQEKPTMLDGLKDYLATHTPEQIKADWAKTEYLDLQGPTVDEFLNVHYAMREETTEEEGSRSYPKT